MDPLEPSLSSLLTQGTRKAAVLVVVARMLMRIFVRMKERMEYLKERYKSGRRRRRCRIKLGLIQRKESQAEKHTKMRAA